MLNSLNFAYNRLIDFLGKEGWSLVNISPYIFLAVLLVLLFGVSFFFKPLLVSEKSPRLLKNIFVPLVVSFVSLFLAFLIDFRFQNLQQRARHLAVQVRSEGVSGIGEISTGNVQWSFDKDSFATEFQKTFPEGNFHVQNLLNGIDLITVRLIKPAEAVGYISVIDLTSSDLNIEITDRYENGKKWLTSDFAKQTGSFLAINGEAGISPARISPLGRWTGNWISRGEAVLLEDSDQIPFLSFDQNRKGRYFPSAVVDRKVTAEKYNTLWGRWDLLRDGNLAKTSDKRSKPRTLMAINADGTRLFLMVVDGRQRGYSEGMGLRTAGKILLYAGATDGMACDQGGSSAMYVRSLGGIINRPSDGIERPTYSHFGIRVGK